MGQAHLDFHAVIGKPYVGRKESLGALMGKIVADVRKVGAGGREFLDDLQGALDRGVRGMGFVAKCVQKQHVEPGEVLHGFFRDLAVIGEIGEGAEAESVDLAFSVQQRHRSAGDPKQIERLAIEDVWLDSRTRGLRGLSGKHIAKAMLDTGESLLGAVNGDRATLAKVERADVVETHDVIGVGMGKQDGVKVRDGGAEGLLSKIGRGVDEDRTAVVLDPDRGPQSLIARVGGSAYVAVAPDGGNANAGAGAKHGELQCARPSHGSVFSEDAAACFLDWRSNAAT